MLDYDFWYEIGAADGDLGPDEAPDLNDEGHLYYVRHLPPGWTSDGQPFWPDSPGFHTLAETVRAAERSVPGPVSWR